MMSSGNLNKQIHGEMSRVEAADGSEGALTATAGAIARLSGVLCCSFVGNGFDGVPFGGFRVIFLASLRS